MTTGGDGFLTASLKLQFTTDGATWTDSGWTVSPSYPYSSSASGQTYTFSGTAVSGVLGARVIGQVRTTDTSYHWILKEVQFTGSTSGGSPDFSLSASPNTVSVTQRFEAVTQHRITRKPTSMALAGRYHVGVPGLPLLV